MARALLAPFKTRPSFNFISDRIMAVVIQSNPRAPIRSHESVSYLTAVLVLLGRASASQLCRRTNVCSVCVVVIAVTDAAQVEAKKVPLFQPT